MAIKSGARMTEAANKGGAQFHEILPRSGQLYQEDVPTTVLCKPKLMPLKSVTLERLEKMQKEAQETVKAQEKNSSIAGKDPFGQPNPSGMF